MTTARAGMTTTGAGTTAALCLLTMIGPLSLNLYTPALPIMTQAIAGGFVSSMQLTLAAYSLTFGLMHVPAGAISDVQGRWPVLRLGAGVYLLASCVCPLVTSALQLTTLRILQGAGAAGVSITAQASVADLFETQIARQRAIGYLIIARQSAYFTAPALGALALKLLGWRWVLALYPMLGALVAIVSALHLAPLLAARDARTRASAKPYPSSSGSGDVGSDQHIAHPGGTMALVGAVPPRAAAAARLRAGCCSVLSPYRSFLFDARYHGYAWADALTVGAEVAFVSAGSYVLQSFYQLPAAVFAAAMALLPTAVIAGVHLAPRLTGMQLSSAYWAVPAGLLVGTIALAAELVAASAMDKPPWPLFCAAGMLMALGRGVLTPLVQGFLTEHCIGAVGSAMAMLNCWRFCAGTASTYIVGVVYDNGPWPTGAPAPAAAVVLSLHVLALVLFETLARRAERSGERMAIAPDVEPSKSEDGAGAAASGVTAATPAYEDAAAAAADAARR